MGLLTRRFGGSVFCGTLELPLAQTLGFFSFRDLLHKQEHTEGKGKITKKHDMSPSIHQYRVPETFVTVFL